MAHVTMITTVLFIGCFLSGTGIAQADWIDDHLGFIPRSSSGRLLSWDIGQNAEIFPRYDFATQTFTINFEMRFKRNAEVDRKQEAFRVVDITGDDNIDACEWTKEGGRLKNFMQFLEADDKNGDEMISWEEFQTNIEKIELNQRNVINQRVSPSAEAP